MVTPEALLLMLIQALVGSELFIGERILNGIADLVGGIVLIIIGVLVIALIVAAAIVLLPAIVVAVVVFLITGSFFYAGIAFLVVALLSIVAVADH
jgi:hypothetical protein